MATITKKNAHNSPDPGFGGVAYGNMFSLPFKFETNSSGYFLDSDTATSAVGNGDKVVLGKIPAGTRLLDMIMVISNAFTAASTFTIGFEYCDGVDVDAPAAEDDDYFCAAQAASSTAIVNKTNKVAPLTIPKDAYLILTVGGAALDEVGVADIEIIGVIGGPH